MKTRIYNAAVKCLNVAMGYRETLSYLFFGVLTTVVGFGLFELLFRTGLSAALSNTCSTVAAVLFAFITNKLWVFGSKELSLQRVCRELFRFAAGRLFTFLLETAALYVLVDRLLFGQTLCKLATSAVVIVLNYIISKKVVFGVNCG